MLLLHTDSFCWNSFLRHDNPAGYPQVRHCNSLLHQSCILPPVPLYSRSATPSSSRYADTRSCATTRQPCWLPRGTPWLPPGPSLIPLSLLYCILLYCYASRPVAQVCDIASSPLAFSQPHVIAYTLGPTRVLRSRLQARHGTGALPGHVHGTPPHHARGTPPVDPLGTPSGGATPAGHTSGTPAGDGNSGTPSGHTSSAPAGEANPGTLSGCTSGTPAGGGTPGTPVGARGPRVLATPCDSELLHGTYDQGNGGPSGVLLGVPPWVRPGCAADVGALGDERRGERNGGGEEEHVGGTEENARREEGGTRGRREDARGREEGGGEGVGKVRAGAIVVATHRGLTSPSLNDCGDPELFDGLVLNAWTLPEVGVAVVH